MKVDSGIAGSSSYIEIGISTYEARGGIKILENRKLQDKGYGGECTIDAVPISIKKGIGLKHVPT